MCVQTPCGNCDTKHVREMERKFVVRLNIELKWRQKVGKLSQKVNMQSI